MDLSKLREVCKRYVAPEYFVEPIPEGKAGDARKRLQIPDSETIVALIDVTINNAPIKRAIVITDTGVCWRNLSDDMKGLAPQRLSWTHLGERPVLEKLAGSTKSIVLGSGLEIELSGASSLVRSDNHLVKQLVTELRTLASVPDTAQTPDAVPLGLNTKAENVTPKASEEKALQLANMLRLLKQYAHKRSSHLRILQEICERHKDCAPEYFVKPIPDLKALNARQSLKIPRCETAIALIDFTVFGGAKESIVFTDRGVHWKMMLGVTPPPEYLSWESLRQYAPKEQQESNGKSIQCGDAIKTPLLRAATFNQPGNHVVIDLINALRTAGLPLDAQRAEEVIHAPNCSGMVECEFCKGKVKPEVTYCKHCGIKLRG